MNLSLDAVPENIDPTAVRAYLESIPGIREVHHLHIWPLSTTETALTVHLVKNDPTLDDELLHQIEHELHHRFEITHPTIQLETSRQYCQGDGC
jgi:cobalt-zinc-cadmium efflux system protein